MPGRRPGRGHVVDGDVVGRAVVDPLAEQHQRRRVAAALELLGAQGDRAEDQPVDEPAADAVEHELLAVDLAVGLVDEHGPALGLGALDHRAGQLARSTGASISGSASAMTSERPWRRLRAARLGR